jgi:hypothetical protein
LPDHVNYEKHFWDNLFFDFKAHIQYKKYNIYDVHNRLTKRASRLLNSLLEFKNKFTVLVEAFNIQIKLAAFKLLVALGDESKEVSKCA